MAARHRDWIEPADLLSDMVVSLGPAGLSRVRTFGFALQLARWRLTDRKRLLREPPARLQEGAVRAAAPEPALELPALSERARVVLQGTAEGATARELAAALGKHPTTIRAQRRRALRALASVRLAEGRAAIDVRAYSPAFLRRLRSRARVGPPRLW